MIVRHIVVTGYLKKWVLVKKVANEWVFCENVYDVITIDVADTSPYTISSDLVEMTETDFIIKQLESPLRPMDEVMDDLNYMDVYRECK